MIFDLLTLTVQESLDYKAHVQYQLKHKKKLAPRKRERGKDRLLKAAAKASQHIRFDQLGGGVGNDENEIIDCLTHIKQDQAHHSEFMEPESTTA